MAASLNCPNCGEYHGKASENDEFVYCGNCGETFENEYYEYYNWGNRSLMLLFVYSSVIKNRKKDVSSIRVSISWISRVFKVCQVS